MGKKLRKIRRDFRRLWRKRRGVLLAVVAAIVFATGTMIERSSMDANYTQLLSTIAEGESKGNYNAYYANAGNTRKVFTSMTVAEVLQWQQDYVRQGNPSSAVGRYQFIEPTLAGLVKEMRIDPAAKFDADLQDKLAIQLLKRRGVDDYLRGRISREEFAHNLSKEWAALPRVTGANPSASYYAGDGLNKVQISIGQVFAAIDTLRLPKNNS